jgi:hypothetical protein
MNKIEADPKFTKICVLTSCIAPNTTVGNITNFNAAHRLNDLVENLKYISSLYLFDYIYIVDSSPLAYFANKPPVFHFSAKLPIEFDPKYFIHFVPSASQEDHIKKKGKGVSEVYMLEHACNFICRALSPNNPIFFKISGRYRIDNIVTLTNLTLDQFQKHSLDACIPHSFLLSKCNTVFYAFSSLSWISALVLDVDECDDDLGFYIEHLTFGSTILNAFVATERLPVAPWFNSKIYSGSKQGRYSSIKMLITFILLTIF